MRIAVASGKGGTGKTTVSIALAETLGEKALLLDCDVEEPNCHLFFPDQSPVTVAVKVMVPEFHKEKCIGCRKCAEACQFNAIALLGKNAIVFPELCHSCGGCLLACPSGAMTESELEIGQIEKREVGAFEIFSGVIKIGHALSVPLIRQLKERMDPKRINILDAPPGTACPMVNTARGCDYVILVSEPTPFGLHDLSAAVDTLKILGVPCGVIINRYEPGENLIDDACKKWGVGVLLRIPLCRKIAEGYSQGKTLLQTAPELRTRFADVLKRIGVK